MVNTVASNNKNKDEKLKPGMESEERRDDDSYGSYCLKFEKYDKYDTLYATAEDLNSDDKDNLFFDMVKRKMEPLYVGDIIIYDPPFGIGNARKEEEGTVVNVDKIERRITTSSMDVLDRMGVEKRISCYDAIKNVIEPQDGVRRYLTEFKLCDESSEELQRNLRKKEEKDYMTN